MHQTRHQWKRHAVRPHNRSTLQPPRARNPRTLRPRRPTFAQRFQGGGPEAIKERAGEANVEHRDRTYRRMLVYADTASAALALIVAITLLGEDQLRATTLLALPLVIGLSKLSGLYDRDELLISKTTIDELPQLFQLATLYTLL